MSVALKIISSSLLIVGTLIAGEKNFTLQKFDSDVLKTQIELQKSCLVTQKILEGKMSAKKVGTATKYSNKHLALALKNWITVKENYKKAIPEQYRNDSLFIQRIKLIESSISQMQKQSAQNDYGASVKTCGGIDDLLVKMHEDNGLNYAIDKLYHLQKAAKVLLVKSNLVSIDSLSILIRPVLDARNSVISSSCPYATDTYKCDCYSAQLDTLSNSIDALAQAVTIRNEMKIKASIQELPLVLEKAYSAALNCTGADKLREQNEMSDM
jgi:hypothetical protein